ncbi:unnamed protein product [Paramecium octaurelia]|uniref:Uncharacterized protein n=1 Tax=Paramecium octaurelia TaxID=43137 RepID=A0A8S1RZL4_PAROT|nr:unnamed protein product [Paramecium octaurelia]
MKEYSVNVVQMKIIVFLIIIFIVKIPPDEYEWQEHQLLKKKGKQ